MVSSPLKGVTLLLKVGYETAPTLSFALFSCCKREKLGYAYPPSVTPMNSSLPLYVTLIVHVHAGIITYTITGWSVQKSIDTAPLIFSIVTAHTNICLYLQQLKPANWIPLDQSWQTALGARCSDPCSRRLPSESHCHLDALMNEGHAVSSQFYSLRPCSRSGGLP